MRFRLSLIVVPLFFWGIVQALPAQFGPDKKIDPKKQEEITEDTKINGKTLDQWIALIPSKDRSQTEIAIQTIVMYGPKVAKKAVPKLLEELKKPSIDISVRVNGCIALGMILGSLEKPRPADVDEAVKVLQTMLKNDQIIVKFRAAQAVAQLGPGAWKTIPELVKMVKDLDTWENRHAAVIALGVVAYNNQKVDKAVAEALYSRLRHSKDGGLAEPCLKVRLGALAALGRLDIPTVGSAPEKKDFLKLLDDVAKNDPDHIVKLRANLLAFPAVTGTTKKEKKAAIAAYLFNEEVFVRGEALQAVASLKESEKALFQDDLDRMSSKDSDTLIRLHANAIVYPLLGGSAKDLRVATIAGYLKNADSGIRIETTHVLGSLSGSDGVPYLIKALAEKDHEVVSSSIYVLGQMGTLAKASEPFLDKIAKDMTAPDALRDAAREALVGLKIERKMEKDKGGAK
jgi:HEAT repeat protein